MARLRIIGTRAVTPLVVLFESSDRPAIRSAALHALEGIRDARAFDLALAALGTGDTAVVLAAVSVLRGWLTQEPGTRALDALVTLALDRRGHAAVRTAALDALSELPRELVEPILAQRPASAARPPLDDAAALREWVGSHGARAPLSALHDAIVLCRERERAETSARTRDDWMAARGAVHAALARRGSRVALYDLRESFDGATVPLPLDFLFAVTVIGDASCLEAMARAWAASPGEAWWREHLQDSAEAIVHRTRLSGRSAVVKRIRARWDGFL